MSYAGIQLDHPGGVYPLQRSQGQSKLPGLWLLLQRLCALAALAALAPLFALMLIAVKLTSRGPFLFSQQRRGRDGKPFKIYKVRTMRPGSEKQTSLGVVRTDPSVTPVGRFLRAAKFDEFPQLWNIVRGEMAIVGPRPIPLALDKELSEKIPGFMQRYKVRPGLTSIGQVCTKENALGEALLADWKLRFQGDLHYLRNRCLSYDLLLIALTALYVLKSLSTKN